MCQDCHNAVKLVSQVVGGRLWSGTTSVSTISETVLVLAVIIGKILVHDFLIAEV